MTGVLDGQVILVTGGGSGIGRSAVDAFVAEGAHVVVLEKFDDKISALKSVHGDDVIGVSGDATTFEANQKAVALALDTFGKIDTLACFVGVWDMGAGLVDLDPATMGAAFDEMFSINVKANLLSAKAASEALIASKGRIIFTISSSGYIVGGGGPLYTASKFAARGLLMELAHELAPVVRVNGVAPGGTISDLRGPAALGQAETRTCAEMTFLNPPLPYNPIPDIHAPIYVALASPVFTVAMTGQVLRPDGGLDIRGISRLNGNAESMFW